MTFAPLEALQDAPLLRGLTRTELERLDEHLLRERRDRGEYVFRRGEEGDALYVVLEGQVAIENPRPGRSALLALCGPGDWFGELAVLTGRPRSADARVTVEASLLRIDREAWAALSVQAPRVFAELCERLSRALVQTNEPPPRARRCVVLCAGTGWTHDLERSLRLQFPGRSVQVVSGGSASAVSRSLASNAAPDALVLLAASVESSALADRVLERVDERRWRITPGVAGRKTIEITATTPETGFERVARHVAGGVIGIALGAGGAYGLSHLGLLSVLEDAGIPIDCVAGTSMGAVVGGALCAGIPLGELDELARRVAKGYARHLLRDLDLRGPTLLKGNAPMRLLGGLGGLARARFEDLELPFVSVAMDLGTGEAIVLQEGPLLEGIRPSFAMPGIFPTCRVGERLLVDGAMACPVPVDQTRALGADFVIAAQPIPRLERTALSSSALRHVAKRVADFVPIWRLQHVLDTLDTSIRSFQALWHRLASEATEDADAVVQADLGAFSFLQFQAADAIIEAGRRAGEAALPELRARLADRVGWVRRA